ncbi:MAG: PQQ-binding-like beta-propeller repeat protein [Xanthobacteraceae bacterium]|nr:PQQ-binding-like beta-propeller repeat protein [Xanthobacteraceae bacterium]
MTLSATLESSPRQDRLAWLVREIQENCIVTSADERLTSSSGKSQNWLIDLRPLFTRADALEAVAEEYYSRFGHESMFQFAGIESASIPLLTTLLLVGNRRGKAVSAVIIRKERKRIGRGRNIEGELTAVPVTVVDDVLNSGESAEKVRVTLEQAGASIKRFFVVIDYQSRKGREWRKRNGTAVHALSTLADFGLELARSERTQPERHYRALGQFRTAGANPYHTVPKSAPLLVGNTIYFGTDAGVFRAIDAAVGKPLWEFDARVRHSKAIWSSPAYHDGRIYFGTYSGNVHCLEALTGAEVWTQAVCDWVGSSPLILPHHGFLAIGLEYARQRRAGSLCALKLDGGQKVWEHWLRVVQHGSAAYWRGGDLVIFGTNDHNVIALSARTGAMAWVFDTRRSVKYAPAVDEERGLVAFASFDRSIYILRVATGEKVAEFETDDICYTTPLFAHGRLFCGSGDKHLYVIDLDSMSLALKFNAGARVYCSPRLIDGSVVFGTNGGMVREMDPVSLEITGTLTVPDAVTNAIAFAPDGKHLFVPTYMNEIYAFSRS